MVHAGEWGAHAGGAVGFCVSFGAFCGLGVVLMARRLVFMGSDPIALPLLDWLEREARERVQLAGVFTQPDRPHGRGQKLTPNAIKTWALERGLPVLQPVKLGPDDLAALRALAPEAVLVMAYGHILRQDWLDAPPCGVWNLHTSLLPKFRGASPIQSAIAAGETETGVALMRMVLRLDAGPVLDVERVAIAACDTGASLEEKLAAACVPLVARNVVRLFDPASPLAPQDDAAATFCRRLRKEDGVLDFRAPAAVLARRINGLFPWPGAFFRFGDEVIRVGLADVGSGPEAAPGTVLAVSPANGLVVATGRGAVRLLRLQRPGGKMLPAPEYLRGHEIPAGTVLASEVVPELVASKPFRS
jgi:methionyl-tRNA formyltransferase